MLISNETSSGWRWSLYESAEPVSYILHLLLSGSIVLRHTHIHVHCRTRFAAHVHTHRKSQMSCRVCLTSFTALQWTAAKYNSDLQIQHECKSVNSQHCIASECHIPWHCWKSRLNNISYQTINLSVSTVNLQTKGSHPLKKKAELYETFSQTGWRGQPDFISLIQKYICTRNTGGVTVLWNFFIKFRFFF